VARDVPPLALVAGNPARVVRWGYDNTVILGDERQDNAPLGMVNVSDYEPGLG